MHKACRGARQGGQVRAKRWWGGLPGLKRRGSRVPLSGTLGTEYLGTGNKDTLCGEFNDNNKPTGNGKESEKE